MQTLFIKWLSSNPTVVEELLSKASSGKLKASEYKNINVENQIHSFRIIVYH